MKNILLSIAIIVLLSFTSWGQTDKTFGIDGDGEFHTGSQIRFGDELLDAGMYRISQIVINSQHFLVIRQVKMNRYGKSMGPVVPGKLVAKVKCTELTVESQNRKSGILIRRNSMGDRVAVEVWFRGESVKHILPSGQVDTRVTRP